MGPIDTESPAGEPIVEDETPETYRVSSHNCVIAAYGAIVTADQLDGLHLASLIAAGHLTSSTEPLTDPDGADQSASTEGN